MMLDEEKMLERLLEREREVAALAAEVARLRMALEAAGVCFLESDAIKIVRLALNKERA